MKKNFYTILTIFLFSMICGAQTLHIIQTGPDVNFFPPDITVQVQDTVRWINSSGGFHNVVADDGSYTSGAASSSVWEFDHIFTSPGDSRYFCSVHGASGGVGMSGIVRVTDVTNIPDNNSKVRNFEIHQNYPNPFNPTTNIKYNIVESDFVSLNIFNSAGQKVKTLVNSNKSAGNHSVYWDSKNDSGNLVSSGIYFYVLKAGNGKVLSRKMILQR